MSTRNKKTTSTTPPQSNLDVACEALTDMVARIREMAAAGTLADPDTTTAIVDGAVAVAALTLLPEFALEEIQTAHVAAHRENTLRRHADRHGFQLRPKGDGYALIDHETGGESFGWEADGVTLAEVAAFLGLMPVESAGVGGAR